MSQPADQGKQEPDFKPEPDFEPEPFANDSTVESEMLEEKASELLLVKPEDEAEAEVFPLADAGPYYVGLWSGFPNYGCPYCGYLTLKRGERDGNGLVELHILEQIDRGDKAHEQALVV